MSRKWPFLRQKNVNDFERKRLIWIWCQKPCGVGPIEDHLGWSVSAFQFNLGVSNENRSLMQIHFQENGPRFFSLSHLISYAFDAEKSWRSFRNPHTCQKIDCLTRRMSNVKFVIYYGTTAQAAMSSAQKLTKQFVIERLSNCVLFFICGLCRQCQPNMLMKNAQFQREKKNQSSAHIP